ncbi:Pex12 amino terminal region-domain-containing protein [Coniella lustricola]|uniref:RING-type E3 ubiquitin transferase n=1 Tax=Coniella lustricola TaxID=2025994 RepID=A0A2T3AMA5_9PEZI|nr:Pex12 amino terminal region-domain-containing protein [Coniella lustricola]
MTTMTSAPAAPDPTTSPHSSSFSFSSPFPFATAPDIIRAHQKDAYFQGLLTTHLVDLHRRVFGARSSHAWAAESCTAADLLYLCLTTLLGNRTLGEEYCDLIQVEAPPSPSTSSALSRATKLSTSSAPAPAPAGPRLPSLGRRSTYITLSVLVPYLLSRTLPTLRARLRARLETRLAALKHSHPHSSAGFLEYRIKRYLLTHLSSLTSGAHIHALVLATFYFSGAYYSLSKRLTGLRYVFTRRLPQDPSSGAAGAGGGADGRAGYEVLGVLLVIQLAVQAYMHIRATLATAGDEASVEAAIRERAFGPSGSYAAAMTGNVSLDHGNSYSSNNDLLLSSSTGTLFGGGTNSRGDGGAIGTGQHRSKEAIARMAHTPLPTAAAIDADAARYDLRNDEVLGWIKGQSQRKCTLCLEELKDPSATGCGHVFCWTCIGDWVREKPECPLCRREVMVQHILPLRL